VRFSDGVYQMAIQEESHLKEYSLNDALSLFGGILTFLIVILSYMRRLTLRIIDLSHEAVEIGEGDLEHEISIKGKDEISILATEVDRMRRSVIERMSNERRAWQANSDLITAISHDIRTPMTTMIGYLELLSSSNFEDKEHCKQFTAAAYDKAMALKDLTDELFKYFLVFGKSELEMNMEPYEAGFLLGQLLAEAEFDLTDAGFTVSRIDFEGSCNISTDPLYLKRVFDNLVSNIKKYAERERPVMLITEFKDEELSVCFSNYISQKRERVESTKIGVRTCEKIMEHMNGSFSIISDDIHFSAELRLPASGIVELLGIESEKS